MKGFFFFGMLNNNVVFLNLQVPSLQATVDDLKFRMYRKPDNCYEYFHFDSCINSNILSGQVVLEVWRIVACFDNANNAALEFQKFI
jgi:hypothetical protein